MIDVALLVHAGAVAGVQPAVAQRLRGLLGLVPVAQHHVRAAHHDLADRAARHLLAVGIDDLHHDARSRVRPTAHSAELARPSPWFAGGLARLGPGFGHAVRLREARRRERSHRPLEHRSGDRRRAVDDALQAR